MSPFGVLLAALVLAQAEAAPPESEPSPPPAEPAPAEPAPVRAPAQEPASPEATLVEPAKDFGLSLGLAGARRLGDTAANLGPRHGFEISMQLGRIYARPGGLELAAGGGFSFQRFRSTVPIKILEGVSPYEDDRTFSFYEFQAHHTAYLPLGEGVGLLRPYLDVGAGFTMAYFSSREPELAPGEKRATRPIASAALGLDVVTGYSGSRAGLAFGYTHVFRAPPLQAPGDRKVDVFGSRAVLRLTFLQPF